MFKKIYLLFATVRDLKLTQIKHQVIYRLKKPGALIDYDQNYVPGNICILNFIKTPPVNQSIQNNHVFNFLNLKVDFGSDINWDFQDNGKLWNYNLQYGNYLLQENVGLKHRIELLNSLHDWLLKGKLPLEPYPVSLRVINGIRLASQHDISDSNVLKCLYGQLDFLSKRPEYHLLGNHLLENAFALLMGGAFFSNKHWLELGTEILKKELGEQILADGAHFELSPMYHQIVLFRILELIDWYASFNEKNSQFEFFLKKKASVMLNWLIQMTFNNGDIPHFNDSANQIAYSTEWLKTYAKDLEIEQSNRLPLKESGYRVLKNEHYECMIDLAEIGPSYQPGHGHADALSFILYNNNKPLFVEQGTSTYQIGERRSLERSTSSHNTVVVGGKNQSEVWGGFRVGHRAKVTILEDMHMHILARQNGYNSRGIIHQRSFDFAPRLVTIIDEVTGAQDEEIIAYFHFHPEVKVIVDKNDLILDTFGSVKFTGAKQVRLETYSMANGYNIYLQAQRVRVNFDKQLKTEIYFL